MGKKQKIGLGGGCHWCTEAVFNSVIAVSRVEQGWVSALEVRDASEAVLVYYDPERISLETLIRVHLHSHSATSAHGMRNKYRSAVYVFSTAQKLKAEELLFRLQGEFEAPLITRVYQFHTFRRNTAHYLDYYYSNPEKPFCKRIILPKLLGLKQLFGNELKPLPQG